MGNNKYNISDTIYNEMSRFVVKLDCQGFDLLILMARKFYSLFMLFHQLILDDLESSGIEDEYWKKYRKIIRESDKGFYERKIINNNAVDLMESDIRNGKYKKIIIADDIIIHGRSVRNLYDKLMSWNSNLEIEIASLIRNDDDDYYYRNIKEHLHSEYVVESDVWKGISARLVEIFYQSSRPYISYLPYYIPDISWNDLCSRIELNQCHEINNELMERYSVKGLLYTGSKIKGFSQFPGASISSIRLYYYEKLNRIVIVPYFCMDVIESSSLNEISDNLREHYLFPEYKEILNKNKGADSVRLRELEYVISLWLGMYFAKAINLPIKTWCYDSEIYSFSRQIVSHDFEEKNKIEEKLNVLIRNIGQIEKPDNVFINEDLVIIGERYIKLKQKYASDAAKWKETKSWSGIKDYEKSFLEELLSVNGLIDEKRFREEKNRLLGIPLSYLITDLGKFFKTFSGDDNSVEWHKEKVFASCISITDSGKGTIFTRTVKNSLSDSYTESLLHAGEQNYIFYENANFPAFYALYVIEMLGKFGTEFEKLDLENRFIDTYKEYLIQENIFYSDKELEQLMTLKVKKDYGKYLLEAYYNYQDNPVLNRAIELALDTVEN